MRRLLSWPPWYWGSDKIVKCYLFLLNLYRSFLLLTSNSGASLCCENIPVKLLLQLDSFSCVLVVWLLMNNSDEAVKSALNGWSTNQSWNVSCPYSPEMQADFTPAFCVFLWNQLIPLAHCFWLGVFLEWAAWGLHTQKCLCEEYLELYFCCICVV